MGYNIIEWSMAPAARSMGNGGGGGGGGSASGSIDISSSRRSKMEACFGELIVVAPARGIDIDAASFGLLPVGRSRSRLGPLTGQAEWGRRGSDGTTLGPRSKINQSGRAGERVLAAEGGACAVAGG